MPAQRDPPASHPDSPTVWYSYAIIRVVPRVERGECLNVGVVLFARTVPYLAAAIALDADRLNALTPHADLSLIARHLRAFEAVAAGSPDGGPVAALPPSERVHGLTSPRSTVIQTSPVHVGCSDDLSAALQELLDAYVRLADD